MHGLDLNKLEIFKEVALAGSFTKAALKLRQPKSRVSRKIASLERELGVQLVYRTTRQFQLTPAGQELYHRVYPILNDLWSTVDQVTTRSVDVAGSLKVTVPEDIGVELMAEFCHEFMALYPKIKIELEASNQMVDLVKDAYDVALRIGRLKDSTLIQKKVGMIRLTLVMSPVLKHRFGEVRSLNQIESLPFLAFTALSAGRSAIRFFNEKESRSVQVTPIFSSNNFFVLRSLAILGDGVTLLPHFVAREAIQKNLLVPILREWSTEEVPVNIVLPHQKKISTRTKIFIDFITQKFSSRW